MKIVGLNIRILREDRKLTLRQLANRLNVSASFISQIENGKAYPSLQNLKRIAESLSTTVVRLVGDGQMIDDNLIMKIKDRKPIHHFGKKIQMYLLAIPDAYKQMEPVLFKLARGAIAEHLRNQHFGQEFAFVIDGSLEIKLADKKYVLNKGESIYFNSSIPHSFRNISKGESVALWVTTPPPG